MDRTKRDLEALVASQKEQLTRYEKRLKDVVTAYKGLLKEKEALETSLNAITSSKETAEEAAVTDDNKTIEKSLDESVKIENATTTTTNNNVVDEKSNLHSQIMTLMNSLATLSAEKSRMEASFQADKKQLRLQLAQKEQFIFELQQQQEKNIEKSKIEVEEMRAKWIIERQEREKETNNQMLMIRELQKLYADERHLKENIEMQLNNFKTEFLNREQENDRYRDLQQQLKETKAQLMELQTLDKTTAVASAHVNNNSNMLLQQLQQEMKQLKEQHAVALKNEQLRVLLAEEQSRKQAAIHEERVANLEARLADLSTSVGKYDRLRYQDQENIHALKRQLKELEIGTHKEYRVDQQQQLRQQQQENSSLLISTKSNMDIMSIVEEIIRLKKLLLQENAKALQPFDVNKIFSVYADHVQCQEEIQSWQQQNDAVKIDLAQLQNELQIKKSHINTLQEKVKVLNANIDEQEMEIKRQHEKEQHAVKEERNKWQQILIENENEYRCKVNELEQQLQKQRQRSLQLLDEKEQEIKALQNSFEIFQNLHITTASTASHNNNNKLMQDNVTYTTSSDTESLDEAQLKTKKKTMVQSKKLSLGENCHMLHYANELARKDIEISGLRKAKYAAETALHKAIQEKVTAQEELNDKIEQLEEQVDRLERCQTREGANLEYLKNVIISFIVTRDLEGKRHMLNAISAVLQFTATETLAINNAFHK